MHTRPRTHSEFAPAPLHSRGHRIQRGLDSLCQAPLDGRMLCSYIAHDPAFKERVVSPVERFSTTLALLALHDTGWAVGAEPGWLQALSDAFVGAGEVHFFDDPALLPADVDCTVLALVALHERDVALPIEPHRVLDHVARNAGADGVLRVYFTDDPVRGARVDPVVCANALSAFARFGREGELAASEHYLADFVAGDAFREGTRYYPSPDLVLYFLSRLMVFEGLCERLGPLLRRRLSERLTLPGNALELASRVVAASRVGMPATFALERLAEEQDVRGGWGAFPCFRYGRTARYFGSEALTTAVALQALGTVPLSVAPAAAAKSV